MTLGHVVGRLVLFVWLYFGFAATTQLAAADPTPFSIWVTHSLDTVFKDTPIPAEPIPMISLLAAGGEYESAQIVIRPSAHVNGVAVEVSGLTGPQGAIGASHLQARFVGYVELRWNSRYQDTCRPCEDEEVACDPCEPQFYDECYPADLTTCTGVSDSEVTRVVEHCETEWFPDPLLEDTEVALETDVNQPVLVTVSVPRDAVPGVYRGKVRLYVPGQPGQALDVPVSLTVLPFDLPEKPSLYVSNWMNLYSILKEQGGAYEVVPWTDDFWRLVRAVARDMAQHRQNVAPVLLEHLILYREDDGTLTFDFSRFDEWVSIFEEEGVAERIEIMFLGRAPTWGQPPFRFLCPPGMPPEMRSAYCEDGWITDAEIGKIEQFVRALESHLREKGWLAKSMVHIGDEPTPDNLQSWLDLSRQVHEWAPQLRRIDAIQVTPQGTVTVPDQDDLSPEDLEIWVPRMDDFNRFRQEYFDALGQEALRSGDRELWYYHGWAPLEGYPNRLIDYPLIKTRLLPWINFIYGATGYLHWAYNWGWTQLCNINSAGHEWSGLDNPGDNWIVYPGKDGPRSSLRWEALRDGLEDYEYFKLLAARRGEALAMELAGRVMSSMTYYDRNPEKLLRIRRQMAREIGDGRNR